MAGTHTVEVDGVGSFTFRRRTIKDQFRIEAEVGRMLGGPAPDDMLRAGALAYATLLILTTQAPDGWDLDELDPLNQEDTDKLFLVHRRLREVETTFREKA